MAGTIREVRDGPKEAAQDFLNHAREMGLSISKRIVEAHGGEMTVLKNAAGGATFRFTLPAYVDERIVAND